MTEPLVFIRGPNVALRPVLDDDLNENYLSWLNDPSINEWSERCYFPTSQQEMRSFFDAESQSRLLLAITVKATHVGNILLSNINFLHRRAELSLLLGDKAYWGTGIAREAVFLLTEHAFTVLGLNRLYAGTFSPAVVMILKKLEWQHEGVQKEHIFRAGEFVDSHHYSILAKDFRKELGSELSCNTVGNLPRAS